MWLGEKNETIYARSIDSTSQGSDSTRVASLTVSNIDKNSPIVAFGTNGSTEYKKEQLTHIMKCHDAVQFPYLYNDILFFIYFLKCAAWLFNRSRFIILK